jgi:hypothetical protein
MEFTSQPWFSFIIGSASTFLVSWFINFLKNKKERKDHIYFLERVIVDQINLVLEIKKTISDFIKKIDDTIISIDKNNAGAYSVETIFFPLFSARQISDDVMKRSSGSGYIDNKVARVFSLSMDLQFIMEDIRSQLKDTLETNQKIAFNKLNPPDIQKKQYKGNLENYRNVLVKETLEHNIPVFLELLAETLIPIEEKLKIGHFRWKISFAPNWVFCKSRKDFRKRKMKIILNMDEHFKSKVAEKLKEINAIQNPEKTEE